MTERPADPLDELAQLAAALEAHPDPAVRGQVTALLQGIDAVHRGALTRLVDAIRAMAGEAFMNRLTADPAVRLLLMSYDLLAVDRRLLAEEALDAVRAHLQTHGVTVELTDVVGGVVYVRLHGLDRRGIAPEAVVHDLEAALREGFLGFQEVVLRERENGSTTFVQLGGVKRAQRPVYRCAIAAAELPNAAMRAVDIDGQSILLAKVDGEVYAVADRCGESPLPLHFGRLEAHVVHCSWHGCRYDVRSGKRIDGTPEGERLTVFPVREQDGEIMVAVGVEPLPVR